jgi:hypothetical protein
VNTHAQGNLKRRLYAASYGPGPDEQRAEIRSIAQTPALHFAGPVYWANVALVAVGSAYVNYVGINHDTPCTQLRYAAQRKRQGTEIRKQKSGISKCTLDIDG